MAAIPKRVEDRIRSALKQFAPILVAQRDRDVSEADTVTLVKDLLGALFGYDKYTELTSEHAIRGTFCDLAIRVEDKLRLLLEVKAIGMRLADKHIRQAVDYAANQGLDWVVLTNAIQWMMFRVHFRKPVEFKLVVEFDLLQLDPRAEADLERVYLLTREGFTKGALQEFSERKDATSRFVIASILCNAEPVVTAIRRELRRVSDVLAPPEAIIQVLRTEVIKRDSLEGTEAAAADRLVTRRTVTRRTERVGDPGSERPAEGAGDTGGTSTSAETEHTSTG